ncbi:uncharacterized protein LOC105697126 [Orussus abietinus]|uniref:uncharacterized protein LOC105697126 n=1 Tax=Orussus abietinus TaxID=222816 RepID=UPI0006255B76|nr:uncharacterized protein LOC105697126 [Orussus abietinus]
MKYSRGCTLLLLVTVGLVEVYGHGMLMNPVNRGSAWRLGFDTPTNWNDNENYCGGFSTQWDTNDGKCGECGDSYSLRRPRPNENGGVYGTGTIVARYQPGQHIPVSVKLSASHAGYFKFSLCPLRSETDLETEECFEKHPLRLVDGSEVYKVTRHGAGYHNTTLVLPPGLTCKHCVLRWNYRTGNSWGICEDGHGAMGCGPQETFRTCSDISIA